MPALLTDLSDHFRQASGRPLADRLPYAEIHDNTVAIHLFRIAQEAVSNAVKHGQATVVRVMLASGAGQVRLRIQDNGKGFPHELGEDRGMGVRIMHYRPYESRAWRR